MVRRTVPQSCFYAQWMILQSVILFANINNLTANKVTHNIIMSFQGCVLFTFTHLQWIGPLSLDKLNRNLQNHQELHVH